VLKVKLLGEEAVGRAVWFGLREIACMNTVEPFCDIGNQFSEDLKIIVFWYLTHCNHSCGYKCLE